MRELSGTEELCRKCDRMVAPETRICACGFPTARATFKERADWEVKQWRAHRQVVPRGRN